MWGPRMRYQRQTVLDVKFWAWPSLLVKSEGGRSCVTSSYPSFPYYSLHVSSSHHSTGSGFGQESSSYLGDVKQARRNEVTDLRVGCTRWWHSKKCLLIAPEYHSSEQRMFSKTIPHNLLGGHYPALLPYIVVCLYFWQASCFHVLSAL